MNAAKFKAMIESVVRTELRRVLPEILSEMYVRRLVSESAESAPIRHPVRSDPSPRREAPTRSRSDLLRLVMEDVDDTPDDFPVPQTESIRPVHLNEVATKLLSKENPLRDLYSDVSLDENVDPEDVSLERLGLNLKTMGKLHEGVTKRAMQNVTDHEASAALAKRRAESIKVGG